MNYGIYIKDVIKQINMSGSGFPAEFSLEYRKADGSYGSKERCRRRVSKTNPTQKKDMASIVREADRARKFQLEYWDGEVWQVFDLFIALVIVFNKKLIDHRI